MNSASGQDLNWYWKPWFFDFATPDLGIVSARMEGKYLVIVVRNVGGLPLPVQLTVKEENGKEEVVNESCRCWQGSERTTTLKLRVSGKPVEVRLGSRLIPDVHPDDNVVHIL